ncbi:hypothetical protein [Paraburkholderia ginsengisoli]|uniref:Uncharacterized protein n=1 Tax=Paraburkholderia ginsengisoli TaxID=311231 RepID=A0A7T4N4Q0_9BURK|nr:hypothetical protein [Paraburkholderia ginsengisoli]QQC65214.1 hypothetical protein I6I06_07075 [Paraburkholderia ginsengisoli]
MGSTELKTDASQRWMMSSKDAYEGGRIFLTTEQKQAVEEGKKSSQRAYADVWAKDAALVQRVRSFLATHFHWHQRLLKSGTDLEVIQTLQSMIRGESVVLVTEPFRSAGSAAAATPAQPTMRSFRESLMTEYGMTYDAATAYIESYNDMVDRVNAVTDRYPNGTASSLADAVDDDLTENATPLGDAQAFDYQPADVPEGTVFDLAKTPNEGDPGTWYTNRGSGQMRLYGDDRKAAVDFDFDHDHGQGAPHAHNWNNGARGPGLPFSLLP